MTSNFGRETTKMVFPSEVLFLPGPVTRTVQQDMSPADEDIVEVSRNDDTNKVQMIKGAAFLSTVASLGLIAGFGSTLALAKKNNPDWFNKGVTASLPESGAALALRALGRGTMYAWCGVGLLSFTVWKLLDVHSLPEFRCKMASLFPPIPKSDTAVGSDLQDLESLFKSK
ncbi:transmembrane protein 242 [Nerophis ophidion]|uniref:transmembrane protein 242 n=1 Tax=Nerophis ophidion TaxID=159077 RepID=UPI002ADF8F2E|nr:transmembrane protein 242 [Nerophis ophidion]